MIQKERRIRATSKNDPRIADNATAPKLKQNSQQNAKKAQIFAKRAKNSAIRPKLSGEQNFETKKAKIP